MLIILTITFLWGLLSDSVKSPLSFGHYPTQAVDLLCAGMFCVGSSADSLCNVSLYFPVVGFDRELHRRGSF